jgi:hypothetical protein
MRQITKRGEGCAVLKQEYFSYARKKGKEDAVDDNQ